MASKLPFIIGLGAGYVLGTRAGRAQYERMKTAASHAASRVAERPFVKDKVDAASTRAGGASCASRWRLWSTSWCPSSSRRHGSATSWPPRHSPGA